MFFRHVEAELNSIFKKMLSFFQQCISEFLYYTMQPESITGLEHPGTAVLEI